MTKNFKHTCSWSQYQESVVFGPHVFVLIVLLAIYVLDI